MPDFDFDRDAMVRVAWLYHVGGMSQEAVGQALGQSRFKIIRMLADAREQGIVRVAIEHETTETLELAAQLRDRFGLAEVIVTPGLGGTGAKAAEQARRAVGIAAAGLLQRLLQGDAPMTIGVGWGRSLAEMARAVTGVRKKNANFVSLMGSLSRTSVNNAIDVCTQLAQTCGGEAYFLPAPFILDSEEACRLIMEQRIVRETLALARSAEISFISVGECTEEAPLFSSGIVRPEEFRDLRRLGTVADSAGKFFDRHGQLVDSELNRRAPSVGIEDLRRQDVVLLAAELEKREAVPAILRAGFVKRLVIGGDLAAWICGSRVVAGEARAVGA